MKKQIVHISVHQSSKVIASILTLLVLLMAIPMAIYSFLEGDMREALLFLIFTPIFYGIIFYISHALGFLIYNFIVKHLGGVEFDVKEMEGAPQPAKEEEITIQPK